MVELLQQWKEVEELELELSLKRAELVMFESHADNVRCVQEVSNYAVILLLQLQLVLEIVHLSSLTADNLLWRKKQMTISILAGVTMIWLLFECIGYHLITFICHSLILSLSTLFLCSNLAAFSGLSPPKAIAGFLFLNMTLLYLIFVMALALTLTLLMLYGKHEDQVDSFAEKGLNELKQQYAILDEKFLHKLPILSGQKQHRS
ncbi:hypothetical protein Pint_30690 [Pistacia integerrima]|uniref:Uncharacterized protein n=1 Tax=Pistacia integerrima TaxID=434235 RepID=A0ACC0WXW6_9ROSI|nr:hypothetical protein Pint_30690 [Pistacia integerrima]